MKNLPYWPTPADVASASGFNQKTIVLSYELAPTGRVHPGILRTLLYAEEVRREVELRGGTVNIVMRINDLAAEKSVRVDQSLRGIQVAAVMRDKDYPTRSALEQLEADLEDSFAAFQIGVERIERVSSIYEDAKFRKIAETVTKRERLVREVLAKRTTGQVTLFNPVCQNCGLMYGVQLACDSTTLAGTYRCRSCSHEGSFDALSSRGLFSFKLETAMMWEYLSADVDLHGQDHIEAYEASLELALVLSLRNALPGRVNLTFNGRGKKVSKSRRNFVPVTELGWHRQERLRKLILDTRWHLPLKLPLMFGGESDNGFEFSKSSS